MEPEGSLPHSQVPANCSYPEPPQSSPYPHIPPPEDPFIKTYFLYKGSPVYALFSNYRILWTFVRKHSILLWVEGKPLTSVEEAKNFRNIKINTGACKSLCLWTHGVQFVSMNTRVTVTNTEMQTGILLCRINVSCHTFFREEKVRFLERFVMKQSYASPKRL